MSKGGPPKAVKMINGIYTSNASPEAIVQFFERKLSAKYSGGGNAQMFIDGMIKEKDIDEKLDSKYHDTEKLLQLHLLEYSYRTTCWHEGSHENYISEKYKITNFVSSKINNVTDLVKRLDEIENGRLNFRELSTLVLAPLSNDTIPTYIKTKLGVAFLSSVYFDTK